MKSISKLVKGAACVGGLAFVGLMLAGVVNSTLKSYMLHPKRYQDAAWINYENNDGRIWNEYLNENISHNQANWHQYVEQVEKINNGKLGGRIILPDLDNNGIVGE